MKNLLKIALPLIVVGFFAVSCGSKPTETHTDSVPADTVKHTEEPAAADTFKTDSVKTK